MTLGAVRLITLGRCFTRNVAYLYGNPNRSSGMSRNFGLEFLGDSTVKLQQMPVRTRQSEHQSVRVTTDHFAVLREFTNHTTQTDCTDEGMPVVCRFRHCSTRLGSRTLRQYLTGAHFGRRHGRPFNQGVYGARRL